MNPAYLEGAALEAAETSLAVQLSNPVAALISVPMQSNLDVGIGPIRGGSRYTMNFQPVIPMSLSGDWNLISRTIVPFVSQQDIVPGLGNQTGLSDTVQSLFFSPAKASKFIWGLGPAFVIPTGGNAILSSGKWSAGPTGVALYQSNGWTFGTLVNQVWSFAGNGARAPVNNLFVQPFITYTTRTATTFSLQTEANYNWQNQRFTAPVIVGASQITRIGRQLISFGLGLKYWGATTDNSPHGFGGRFTITLLYPR